MKTWRLIPLETNNAPMNMAIDEAILTARISGKVPNTLRFYRWHPSAVSIGRNQILENEVYAESCRKLGVDVVRRCSGGGTVYHDFEGEVTYSVNAKVADLGSNDVASVYFKIYEALTDGLRIMGIPADFCEGNAKNCPNLMAAGKKISGSSQNLSRGFVLQHGTILRSVDLQKMFTLLKLKNASCAEAVDIARSKITSVQDELVHKISPETIANALSQGFKAILKIQLEETELTTYEKQLSEKLYKEKYSTTEWNLKGKKI